MNFCLLGDCKVKFEYKYLACTLNEDGDFKVDEGKEQHTIPVNQFIHMIVSHLREDNLYEFNINDNNFIFLEFNGNTGETYDYFYKILSIEENL